MKNRYVISMSLRGPDSPGFFTERMDLDPELVRSWLEGDHHSENLVKLELFILLKHLVSRASVKDGPSKF